MVKDYTQSQFHRYKVAGSKNFQNIFPPNNVLHLSNLSDNLDQSYFNNLFREEADILNMKFLGDKRRMALVKFRSIEDAVKVLVVHHNRNISGRFLKISFSKAVM